MKIKCRGYLGELISLDATETVVRKNDENLLFESNWYDIEIRAENGAKVFLSRVMEAEISLME